MARFRDLYGDCRWVNGNSTMFQALVVLDSVGDIVFKSDARLVSIMDKPAGWMHLRM